MMFTDDLSKVDKAIDEYLLNLHDNQFYRNMKRLVIFIVAIFSCALSYGQGTIKFLGIPVDGRESDMVFKLRQKGFKMDADGRCLEGTFNGKPSFVYIHTNNRKVDRIMVADQHTTTKGQIRIQYNNLLEQFKNNDKYLSLGNDPRPEDENIAYEMTVHDKDYSAHFYLNPFSDEFADDEYIDKLGDMAEEEVMQLILNGDYETPTEEQVSALLQVTMLKKAVENSPGVVWFKIAEAGGGYYLAIFYDNYANQAHGEDL